MGMRPPPADSTHPGCICGWQPGEAEAICPIVLGKGKRIFGNTSHQVALKLIKSETTPTGVIIANYERTSEGNSRRSN
jgi:hypothetical protein